MAVSEDLFGVSNFDGYFTSVIRPGAICWLERGRDQSAACQRIAPPERAPVANAGRARLAQGVPTVRIENRFRHRDGSWRWIAWTLTADAGPVRCRPPHHHRKEAAERLRASERRLRCSWRRRRLRPRHARSGRQRDELERRRRTHQGLSEREIIGHLFSQFYTTTTAPAACPTALSIAAATGKFEAGKTQACARTAGGVSPRA